MSLEWQEKAGGALSETPELIGFFSYSREDDCDSDNALSLLRTRIQNELRAQLGRSRDTLRLWQDAEAIPPGTLWESQIDAAVAQASFFIPIVTPRVVQSKYCGIEFHKFLARERDLGRSDLVFPILFIEVSELGNERLWRSHPVLNVIGQRQYVDWREFRYDPDSVAFRRAVAQFCAQIIQTLRRHSKDSRDEPIVRRSPARGAGLDLKDRSAGAVAERPADPGGSSIFAVLWGRIIAFDEANLPIEVLVTYAVGLSTLLTCGYLVLLGKSGWTVDTPTKWLAATIPVGLLFGSALAMIYWILEARDGWRLLGLVGAVTIGWLLAMLVQLPIVAVLGSWFILFGDPAFHPLKATVALGVAGAAGSLGILGGIFVIDRGLFQNRRRIAFLVISAIILGVLAGASLVLLPSSLDISLLKAGILFWVILLTWQTCVSLCIFRGRRDAIMREQSASTLGRAPYAKRGRSKP